MADSSKLSRLTAAMKESRTQFRQFQDRRREMMQYTGGRQYSDAGGETVMDPTLYFAKQVLGAHLAPGIPQLSITAKGHLKPAALDLQATVNDELKSLEFGKILRLAVDDGLYGPAIVKCGVMGAGWVDLNGESVPIPQTYLQRVSFDDLVVDATCQPDRQPAFIGNRYRIRKEVAEQMPQFSEEGKAKLKKYEPGDCWLDTEGDDKASDLSQEGIRDYDKFGPYIEAIDVFDPYEGMLYTLNGSDESAPPLMEMPWDGPMEGLYFDLRMGQIPDNWMNFAPLAAVFERHVLLNALWDKSASQARNQKTLYGAQSMSDADCEKIARLPDRSLFGLNGGTLTPMSFPGADQANLATMLMLRDSINKGLGNLDLIAGLGPQSPTASQDKLLTANASKLVEDMGEQVMDFALRIMRVLAWYHFYNPFEYRETTRKIPGTKREVSAMFNPDIRRGHFLDYNFDLDPYSMRSRSPAQRWQNVANFLQTFGPYMQLAMQQGIGLKFEDMMRLYSRYLGMDNELEDVVAFLSSDQTRELAPRGEGPMKPPVTQRSYERVGRPGMTSQGADNVMMQQLMGGSNSANLASAMANAG